VALNGELLFSSNGSCLDELLEARLGVLNNKRMVCQCDIPEFLVKKKRNVTMNTHGLERISNKLKAPKLFRKLTLPRTKFNTAHEDCQLKLTCTKQCLLKLEGKVTQQQILHRRDFNRDFLKQF